MKNYQKGHSIVALSAPKQSLPAAKNNISFLKVSLFSRSGAFNVYFVPSSDFQVPAELNIDRGSLVAIYCTRATNTQCSLLISVQSVFSSGFLAARRLRRSSPGRQNDGSIFKLRFFNSN